MTHCGVMPIGIWLRFLPHQPGASQCQTNPVHANKPVQRSAVASSHPAKCSVCGRHVTDELEFQIEFARDGDNPGLDRYHVHIRCFAAWEFERGKPRP